MELNGQQQQHQQQQSFSISTKKVIYIILILRYFFFFLNTSRERVDNVLACQCSKQNILSLASFQNILSRIQMPLLT